MTIGIGAEGRRGTSRRPSWGLGPRAIRRGLDLAGLSLFVVALITGFEAELLMDGMWITLVVGAFLFGLQGSLVRVGLAGLGTVGVLAAEALRTGSSLDPVDLVDWLLLTLLAVSVTIMADHVAGAARRYGALYRQASDRLVAAHEDERLRLARDLHDGVGQTLTATLLTLDAAEASLPSGRQPSIGATRSAIRQARTLAAAALDEARDVAARLRPVRIAQVGLGPAIAELAAAAGRHVELAFSPGLLPPALLSPEREIDAFRVVQEGLANASRHARAERITIDATVHRGRIRISIVDDGVGFRMRPDLGGMGLAGMVERVASLDGRLTVHSRPGRGTTVAFSFPVRSAGLPTGRAAKVKRRLTAASGQGSDDGAAARGLTR